MTAPIMNLAAAWKSFAADCITDYPRSELDDAKRIFYAGATGVLIAQENIMNNHDGEASIILLDALNDECAAVLADNEEPVA